MKRLLDGMKYHPAADHNDPNYLRRRFAEIDPSWNKAPRKRKAKRLPENVTPIKRRKQA